MFEFADAVRVHYEGSSVAWEVLNIFLLHCSVCSVCCTHSIRIGVRPLCTPSNSSELRSYGISARLRVLELDGRRALHLLLSLAQLCNSNAASTTTACNTPVLTTFDTIADPGSATAPPHQFPR